MDLYCDAPAPEAEDLLRQADRAAALIAGHMGLAVPACRPRVYVFDSSWAMYVYLAEHCPQQKSSRAACFETSAGYALALVRRRDREQTLQSLRHETTHWILASRYSDLPRWIDEGLAQYFEAGEPFGKVHEEKLDQLRSLLEENRPLLEPLVTMPSDRNPTSEEYAAAWGLTYFLIKHPRFGLERIKDYMSSARSGPKARATFVDVFGCAPRELEIPLRLHLGAK